MSGITFSYLSTGGKQSLANTFNSGCLSITIEEESAALDLTGVYPVSDVEGLSGDSYDFTIKNIGKNESKKYHLKYDTTKEQGANKVYKSVINVTAGTNVENKQASEIKFPILEIKH